MTRVTNIKDARVAKALLNDLKDACMMAKCFINDLDDAHLDEGMKRSKRHALSVLTGAILSANRVLIGVERTQYYHCPECGEHTALGERCCNRDPLDVSHTYETIRDKKENESHENDPFDGNNSA